MFVIQCGCGHQDVAEKVGVMPCPKCGADTVAKYLAHDILTGITSTETYDTHCCTEHTDGDTETQS